MKRREFLKQLGVGAGALSLAKTGWVKGRPPGTRTPNILFLILDELRFPRHFPSGVSTPDEFVAKFMPNLYEHVWNKGVVFTNHRTSASACTPSRSALVTGLHSQQTWILQTVAGAASSYPPNSLQTAFPTYGRLLRNAGYATPYFGKFHLTSTGPYDPNECSTAGNFLEPYGFTAMTCPDMVGDAGTGDSCGGTCYGDAQIADAAVAWFSQVPAQSGPFCATLSFVNPHDREYFWAGTEASTYMSLFEDNDPPETPLRSYDVNFTGENDPAPQGFPPLPPNWESYDTLKANKPKSQLTWNSAHQTAFGGVSFVDNDNSFILVPSETGEGELYKAVAPFSYWQRGQDSYIQCMQLVDEQVGRVFDAIPAAVRQSLVVVFTTDHGEYSGSHGFNAGKEGTAYEEILNIPLVVRDYGNRFAGHTNVKRHQITSSIDILPLLVTLGYDGSTDWITGDLQTLYGNRLSLLDIVRSPLAPGRRYHLFSTDELIADILNFNAAPLHIQSMVTNEAKVVVYSFWEPGTTQYVRADELLEFYDYSTEGGRQETANTPDNPLATRMANALMNTLVPNEIRQPLPASLQAAQAQAEADWLAYRASLRDLQVSDIHGPGRFPPGIGG